MRKKKTPEERAAARARSNANLMDIREVNARRTPEQRREIARKAGQASAAARAERKNIRQICDELLSREAPEAFLAKVFDPDNMPEKGATVYEAIVAQMAQQAAAGNVRAATFIRDSAGDMPTNKVQTDVSMTEADRKLLANIAERIKKQENGTEQ